MNTTSSREIWVDVVKAMAIILVVFGHAWRGMNEAKLIENQDVFLWVDTIIYSFHMPLFFMISGFLFFRTYTKNWNVFLKNQLLLIVWPYFLWTLIFVAMKTFLASSVNHQTDFLDVYKIIYEPFSIFWFLYVLFLSQIIVKFVLGGAGSTWLLLFIAGGFVVIHFLMNLESILILNFLFKFFLFFVIGFGVARLNYLKNWSVSSIVFYCSVFVFFLTQTLFIFEVISLDTVAGLIAGGFLCFSFIMIFQYLCRFNLFKSPAFYYLSTGTMAIYVVHILFTSGTRIVLMKLNVLDIYIHIGFGTLLGVLLPLIMREIACRLNLTVWAGLGAKRK